jgi:hypothetical protein
LISRIEKPAFAGQGKGRRPGNSLKLRKDIEADQNLVNPEPEKTEMRRYDGSDHHPGIISTYKFGE